MNHLLPLRTVCIIGDLLPGWPTISTTPCTHQLVSRTKESYSILPQYLMVLILMVLCVFLQHMGNFRFTVHWLYFWYVLDSPSIMFSFKRKICTFSLFSLMYRYGTNNHIFPCSLQLCEAGNFSIHLALNHLGSYGMFMPFLYLPAWYS